MNRSKKELSFRALEKRESRQNHLWAKQLKADVKNDFAHK